MRIDAHGIERLPGQRIEECLIELAIDAVGDQLGVFDPDEPPSRPVGDRRTHGPDQAGNAAVNVTIVKLDALDRITLTELPFALGKPAPRTPRDRAELPVVLTERTEDRRRGIPDQRFPLVSHRSSSADQALAASSN